MAQFVCDPELTSGQIAQAAERVSVGDVYKWEPGGDAEAYVNFVGAQFLVLVGTDVYRRSHSGTLVPHNDQLAEPHIVFKPIAADPEFMSEHKFKTMFALIVESATAAPDLTDGPLSPAEQPSPPASPVLDESGRQVETGAAATAPVNENTGSVVPPTTQADPATAGDGEALTTAPSPATPKPKGKPGPKPKAAQ